MNAVKNRCGTIAEPLEARCLLSAGSPDTTFNTTGARVADFGGTLDEVLDVATQSDGKIVAVGYKGSTTTYRDGGDVAVMRLLANGQPDTSFGTNGLVTLNFGGDIERANAVAIQSDGQIVVGASIHPNVANAYWGNWEIIRLNGSNGSLDSTFGGGTGRVVTDFDTVSGDSSIDQLFDLAIQSDGKIVACGEATPHGSGSELGLARYNTNGTLDTSFNGSGIRLEPASIMGQGNALTIDPSTGRIVVVGTGAGASFQTVGIARFLSTGALDTSFNTTGYKIDDIGAAWCSGVVTAMDESGYYVLTTVGTSSPTVTVRKYTSAGSLDTAHFGVSSTLTLGGGVTTVMNGGFFGTSPNLTLDHSGNIVVVASTGSGSTTIAKFDWQGRYDHDFNGNWYVTRPYGSDTSGVAIDSQNRIVGFDSTGWDSEIFRLTSEGYGSITGRLVQDVNGDGSTRTPLSGYTVYADTNENGVYDSSVDYAATTDSSGNFTISNILASNPNNGYPLRVVLPSGWGADSSISVDVPAGSINFGDVLIFHGQMNYGSLFNDANGNGIQDIGEGFLTASGLAVYIDSNGNFKYDSGETKVSVTNGLFSIVSTAAGTMRLLYPNTYRQTYPTSDGSLSFSYTAGIGRGGFQFGAVASTFTAISNYYDVDSRYVTFIFDRGVRYNSSQSTTLTLKNIATGQTITLFNVIGYIGNSTKISFEPVIIGNPSSPTLPQGNYQATLAAGSVTDFSGNALPNAITFNFFSMAADANHDRTVNALDFNALATNYGKAGSFSQGDFNYSGTVDSSDFALLASKYGSVLAAPSGSAVPDGSASVMARATSVLSQPTGNLFSDQPLAGISDILE